MGYAFIQLLAYLTYAVLWASWLIIVWTLKLIVWLLAMICISIERLIQWRTAKFDRHQPIQAPPD